MLSFLIGESFIHNSFGKGIVTKIDGDFVTIKFNEGEKKFTFPGSFIGNKFMKAESPKIQNQLDELASEVAEEVELDEDETDDENVIYLDEYEIDCDEYLELLDSSDFEIDDEGSEQVSPRSRANVYLLNFYGPVVIDELIEINETNYYSNLNSLFKENVVSWSVPNNAVSGDIAVFMCANSAKAKCSRLCSEIKQNFGTDFEIYDFAATERDVYKKYSGHIVAWGVLTSFPEEESRNSKLGYADININGKFAVPVPYSEVKDLFNLNVYGSATKLTQEQWEDMKKVIRGYNPKKV